MLFKKLHKLALRDNNSDVIKKATKLREKGFSVSTYAKAKKLGKQLNQFEGFGYRGYAVFEGEETEVKEFGKH